VTTRAIIERGWTVFVRALVRSLAVAAVAVLIYAPGWAVGYFLVSRVTLMGPPQLSPSTTAALVATLVAVGILELIPMGALLTLYAKTALDAPCSIAAALKTGLNRMWPMLGVTLLSIAAMFGFIVVLFALVLGLSLAVRALPQTAALIVRLAAGIPLAIVAVVAYIYLYTTITVALSACADEGAGPLAALQRSIERCLSAAQRKRALLVGIVSVVPLQVTGLVLGIAVLSASRVGPIPFWSLYVVQLTSQAALFLLGYAWITVFSVDARGGEA